MRFVKWSTRGPCRPAKPRRIDWSARSTKPMWNAAYQVTISSVTPIPAPKRASLERLGISPGYPTTGGAQRRFGKASLSGFVPCGGGARDPDLRRRAGPTQVRVVLQIGGRSDFDAAPGSDLEARGLVEQLLIARAARGAAGACARSAQDVQLIDIKAEHPPLSPRELVRGQLDRGGVVLADSVGAVGHTQSRAFGDQPGRQTLEVAAVRSRHDRHRPFGSDVATDRVADGSHNDVIDLAGVEPTQHRDPVRLEMLEALGGLGGI